jgi:Icc-related predicted phosphoesterase
MQILTISDVVAREVYSPTAQVRFKDARFVLSCGDLPPSYLEFVVSTLNVPLLYVPGNHDGRGEITESGKTVAAPQGCINIDGRITHVAGLWVYGLGGAPWYNGGAHQYTEREMWLRVFFLLPRLLLRERRTGRPFDIMIAHAAAHGILDGPGAHRGFKSLRWLVERIQPRFFIHGHVHPSYGYNRQTEAVLGRTRIINTVGYRLLDMDATPGQACEPALG